jgi:hypothetical protein
MNEPIDRSPSATSTPSGDNAGQLDPQLVFIEELEVEEHAVSAGDVIEIDSHTWAIHGSIAVDGDVIMAEYDTEEHARIVLHELSSFEDRDGRR